jgi:S1-C subfamily serine protease
MVPTSILERTFHIAFGNQTASAFTIEVENLQYLVTAKHVLDGWRDDLSVQIMRNKEWSNLTIKNVWLAPSDADVALISLSSQLSPTHDIVVGGALSFFLSQQMYFLGYPFGLRLDFGQVNSHYPLPFVKTGIVSGFSLRGAGSQILFCDGHNNPGFSGGPMITIDPDRRVHVIGVVSGYRHHDDPILYNGAETGLTHRSNTGLVIGYGLEEVIAQARIFADGASCALENSK